VYTNRVSAGYFATLRTALLAGRDLAAGDRRGTTPVAVVNERFAREVFGGANPVGQQFETDVLARGKMVRGQVHEIVGLVRDARYRELRAEAPATVYFALAQAEPPIDGLVFSVRGAGATAAARAVLRRTAPAWRYRLGSYPERVRDAVVRERLLAELSTVFGGLALLLAGIGLYGVLSYSVSCRRGEIGVRMALGARPADIGRWVLRQSVWTVAGGAAAGVALAAWLARFATKMLYGVPPADPAVLASGVGVLLACAAVAAWAPARRAARLDPMRALRHE